MKKFFTLFALLFAFLYLLTSTVSEKIIDNSLRITVIHPSEKCTKKSKMGDFLHMFALLF